MRLALRLFAMSLALATFTSGPLTHVVRAEPADHTMEVTSNLTKDGGTLNVVVTPQGRWHWNKDYPAKLSFEAPQGVVVAKPMLTQQAGDFTLDAKAAKGAAPFTGKLQVPAVVKVTGKFGLCDDKVCIIKKVDTTATIAPQP
jgi:hypothetical protein